LRVDRRRSFGRLLDYQNYFLAGNLHFLGFLGYRADLWVDFVEERPVDTIEEPVGFVEWVDTTEEPVGLVHCKMKMVVASMMVLKINYEKSRLVF
jgi:hypothetical protein